MAMADRKPFTESKFFFPVFMALIFIAEALLWDCLHINLTKRESLVSQELQINEYLLAERKKMEIEIAALKSPQRIEIIAKNRLKMQYPGEIHHIR